MLMNAITFIKNKLESKTGMEMLQSILLVALAVGIGTLLFATFGADGGVIDTALESLSEKFEDWFR